MADTSTGSTSTSVWDDSSTGTLEVLLREPSSGASGVHLRCPTGNCTQETHCERVHPGLVAPVVMAFVGVVGNVLALGVLHQTRADLRRSAFYTLVGGLALTDLIGQCCTAPIAIVAYSARLSLLRGHLCNFHGFMMVGFGLATPLIVCLMALERVGALCWTYLCSRFLSRHRARVALGACWAFAFSFAVLPFVDFGRYELQYPCSWCFLKFHFNASDRQPRHTRNAAAYACLFAVINLVVIAVSIVSNIIVIVTLLRARKRRRLLTGAQRISRPSEATVGAGGGGERPERRETTQAMQDLELQMVWLLCGMTVVFSCCWTPFMVQIITSVASGSSKYSTADVIVVRAAAFNQILDPWVYILLRRSVLRKLRDVVRRAVLNGGMPARSRVSALGRQERPAIQLLATSEDRPEDLRRVTAPGRLDRPSIQLLATREGLPDDLRPFNPQGTTKKVDQKLTVAVVEGGTAGERLNCVTSINNSSPA